MSEGAAQNHDAAAFTVDEPAPSSNMVFAVPMQPESAGLHRQPPRAWYGSHPIRNGYLLPCVSSSSCPGGARRHDGAEQHRAINRPDEIIVKAGFGGTSTSLLLAGTSHSEHNCVV